MKSDDKFLMQVEKARKRVHRMDDIDGVQDRYLATIHAALESGLRGICRGGSPRDVQCVFEAFVMLEDRARQEQELILQRMEGK